MTEQRRFALGWALGRGRLCRFQRLSGKSCATRNRATASGKFVSGRGALFNVWGIHFDPAQGKPIGEPFRVSAFEGHGPMIPRWIPLVELSLSENKLVLNMAEVSGGIWVLDNVNRWERSLTP